MRIHPVAAVLSLTLSLTLVGALPAQAATESPLLAAIQTEVDRAMGLRLPDSPPPYLVSVEVLDGQVATAQADFGALSSSNDGPYRTARVDVRVGNYTVDNGNFEGNFGADSGTRMRLLPDEDVELALRRELWLALDHAYKGATQQLSEKLAARQGVTREFDPDLYPITPLVTPPVDGPDVAVKPLEALVKTLSGRLAGLGLEEGSAIARDWQGVRVLVSSEGDRAYIPTGFTVVRVEAVARAKDGARIHDTRSWVVDRPDRLPAVDEMLADVDDLAAWVDQLRTAPVEDDYLGPVLFEGPASVELFRQLLAPELSGTPPPETPPDGFDDGQAVPTARVGRRLLPEGWTVVDDPALAHRQGRPGGYATDFEGVAAQRVEVVEDGVVRTLLMSRVPRAGFSGSTGHGRSLGRGRRVAIPDAVTVTPARPRSLGRLQHDGLALARHTVQPYVLVVRRLEPPAVSDDFRVAFSGDAPLPGLTRPTQVWRLYPDGHTQPVRGLEFVGVRVLRDIVRAARIGPAVGVMDASPGPQRFSIGSVSGLPASWATPAVLVSELELHGSGGHEPRVLPAPDAGFPPG
ncbi:MAG: hypothetical protein GXP62_19245 [Oligoflexia bacterium]|nr:hypothetical protein [Oligoflexia bacterium]